MSEPQPVLYVGISQLVQPHEREGASLAPLDVVEDAALLVAGGRLVAAGARDRVQALSDAASAVRIDLGGRAIVPGLIDSHSHVVFAGERIDEFARRARGETYEQIAQAGGGIRRSAAQLASATEQELVDASVSRLETMLSRGTTTCEIKSGYGLTPENEIKHLQAIRKASEHTPMQVLATVLAHTIPPDARADRQRFVDEFCAQVIARAAQDGLARYCDVFVEQGAFTPDEAQAIARVAARNDLGLKLHVDQLREGGGASLAAELGALSADHLEHVSAEGRRKLAVADVTATLLPGAALFMRQSPWPDGRALRRAGCEVAIATDANPGSSMVLDLLLCATLGATRCGLSLEEALWAVTRGGAKALRLNDRGRLAPGERADFLVADHADWRALLYRPAHAPIQRVVVGGQTVWRAADPRA